MKRNVSAEYVDRIIEPYVTANRKLQDENRRLREVLAALCAEAEASINTLTSIANGPAGTFAYQAADRLRDAYESPNGDAVVRARVLLAEGGSQ